MLTKRLAQLAAAGAAATLLTACGGGGDPLSEDSGDKPAQETIAVGSANFPEAILLGELYAQALQANGVQVEKKLNIGSREVYIPAVQDGSVDLVPEYTGNLLLHFDKEAQETEAEPVEAALRKALPDDLITLDKSQAVDEDAIVVSKKTAERYNLKTIEDLKPIAGELVVGGSPEFRERKAGLQGLEEVYGLQFKEYKTLDSAGPITVEALKSGEVDVSQLFTTQSAITANDFVVLEDTKHIYIAQNIVPLIRESKASDQVTSVLNEISAALTTENVTELVYRIEVDHENPDAVAKDFLTKQGLI